MPKYLFQGNYINEGIGGLLKEGGTSRETAITALVQSLGGTPDSLYYAFGDIDVYGIADFPDNVSAAAFALQASASGLVSVTTVPLMTPSELDLVAQKNGDYRAPGHG